MPANVEAILNEFIGASELPTQNNWVWSASIHTQEQYLNELDEQISSRFQRERREKLIAV